MGWWESCRMRGTFFSWRRTLSQLELWKCRARDSWRRCSQNIQWLIGCSEGHSTQQFVLYLKGSTITKNLAASECLDDDSISYGRWASDMLAWILCKLWWSKDYWKVELPLNVRTRRQRWSSAPQFTTREIFLIVFTLMFEVLLILHHLKAIGTLSLLLMIVLSIDGYILWDRDLKS